MVSKKLKSKKGESLVEAFAAILIASLSVAFLMVSAMAAANMNRAAESADKGYYESITAAETKALPEGGEPAEGKAEINGAGKTETIAISFYGGEGMYFYREKQGDGL